jgi:hypothetical protein
LKITLDESRPAIWRRVAVSGAISFAELHAVIQLAMGWTNSHLHAFEVGDTRYGPRYPHDDDDGTEDERTARLDEVVAPKKGARFTYWYDFGDDWLHDVAVKAVGVSLPEIEAPHCLEGLGACPPEDCGGTPGYANLLEVLADPRHQDHAEILEWVGGGFDPAEFDIDAVNEELARVAKRWSRPSQRRRAPASSL